MNALSLFSGIGGLDLAAEAAGITTAAFVEIDPFCQKLLAKRWPGVPIFPDIFNVRGDEFEAVELIHGGFPCQPFSLAGRKEGRNDDRYLWPEFSRLVGRIRPRWVVAENVPGIFQHDAAGDVCADLERLGYSVGIWNFEAAAVGAPHRRSRVFFVGHSNGGGLSGHERRENGQESEDGRKNVSDAERRGRNDGFNFQNYGTPDREVNAPDDDCGPVHDANGEREQQQKGLLGEVGRRIVNRCEKAAPDNDGKCGEELRKRFADGAKFGSAGCDSWWESEPEVGRVAHGVPGRVDRLRALGNAVVPAQAYPLFKAIAEIENLNNQG